MNDDIHGKEAAELHERNKRAMSYLDKLAQRDEDECATPTQKVCGCIALLAFNLVFWWAVYTVIKAISTAF